MTPKQVMTQLVEAALNNDAQGVYALLASGEPVEMPGIALCRAISSGSVDAALTLAGEGVTLAPYPSAAVVPNDTLQAKEKRMRFYFSKLLALRVDEARYSEPIDDDEDDMRPKPPAPGSEHNGSLYLFAASLKCGPVIEALINAGLLSGRDRAGLMLVAAYHWVTAFEKPYFDLYVLLAKSFKGAIPPYPTIDLMIGGMGDVIISDPVDCALTNYLDCIEESMDYLALLTKESGVPLSYAHLVSALTDIQKHARFEREVKQAVKNVGLEVFGGGPMPKRTEA